MDINNRKNETRADAKANEIAIEVLRFTQERIAID